MPKIKNVPLLANFLAAVILFSFIAMTLSLVWAKGICCGDDAYFAVIAKNLANGMGFTSTVQPFVTRYVAQQFDPLVGTIPTIIFPAALSIKIFGNTYWAPGLSNVILWSVLLISIGIFLQKNNYGIGFALFTFSFLYLAFTLMPYHFEQWYALLGEIPAALLIIMATLCFFRRNSSLNQTLTGLLFSLAVQSKFLALFGFLVFLVIQMLVHPGEQSVKFLLPVKRYIKRLFYIGAGFILPYVFFESWKFFILGPHNYIEHWRAYFEYAGRDGISLNHLSSLTALLVERLNVLLARFGILLPNIGLVLMLVWLMIKKDQHLRQLYIVLTSIVVVYSFWWIFLSIGWARYYIISLVLLIFVISLPLLLKDVTFHIYFYLVLIVVFTSNNWGRLRYPFEDLDGQYFSPAPSTKALIKISNFLSQEVENETGPIATEWWATAADIEYMMNDSLNFTTIWDDDLIKGGSFWVAANTKFTSKTDTNFTDLLQSCEEFKQMGVYVLARCSPSALVR